MKAVGGLSAEQRRRYVRQLMLPEVGEAGQLRLLDATVGIVGLGGLGSPAALYLAAAGVGTLRIIDGDNVEESNLQRQLLHTTDRVGCLKTESARDSLSALNPGIEIVPHQVRLSDENARELIGGCDVVIDASDSFATRYVLSDTCVALGLPNVHGSVDGFEGQVTVFHPPAGPCYRCLFPAAPADQTSSSGARSVLGVLPGVVGVLQAAETIKLILGIGDSLVGRVLHYDMLRAEFRTLRLARDAHCSCGRV